MNQVTNMHGETIHDVIEKIPFDVFWKYFENNVTNTRFNAINDAANSLYQQCEFNVNILNSDRAVVSASLPDGSYSTEVSYYEPYKNNDLFDCTPYYIISKCRQQIQDELRMYLTGKIDNCELHCT